MFDRYLHALFVAIDGNFVSNRKDKISDPEDFPLSKGAGYFVNEDDAKRYEAGQGEFKAEVGSLLFSYALRLTTL